jgi:hypothetical protein
MHVFNHNGVDSALAQQTLVAELDVVSGEHSYRFGVALRALVVVSDIKVSGALTLPVVAAKVELMQMILKISFGLFV